MDKYKQLRNRIKYSPFNRQNYTVDADLRNLSRALMFFIHDEAEESINSIFKYGIPGFQRDSDKWTQAQQVSFVENTLQGFKPELMLFTLTSLSNLHGSHARCFILDGLQRITALAAFERGDFKVFDNTCTHQELVDYRLINSMNYRASIKIFTFAKETDAIEFYIAINKGITHSNEDIERAKKYLRKYKTEPDFRLKQKGNF